MNLQNQHYNKYLIVQIGVGGSKYLFNPTPTPHPITALHQIKIDSPSHQYFTFLFFPHISFIFTFLHQHTSKQSFKLLHIRKLFHITNQTIPETETETLLSCPHTFR